MDEISGVLRDARPARRMRGEVWFGSLKVRFARGIAMKPDVPGVFEPKQ